MTENEQIIEILIELRKQHGLTQKAMAEKIGMYPNNYSRIESMKHKISLPKLAEILAVFGKKIWFTDIQTHYDMIKKASDAPKPIMRHISGVKGVFVNRYTPTGHRENILIDCGDGIKFHAPADEFEII